VALTRESVDLSNLEKPAIVDRALNPRGKDYLPFRPAPQSDTPYFAPIGGPVVSRQTSSMHGEDGYITAQPREIHEQVERLRRKLESNVENFTLYQMQTSEGAKTLLVTYGVTSRSARRAAHELTAEGRPVSQLTLKTLWPVPSGLIASVARDYERVIVIEANLGQYVREVERVLRNKHVEFYGRMDGRLISPAQIKEAILG
jgi:2-oxoglutarate ferredoxin oxidoreductase subunit alpha